MEWEHANTQGRGEQEEQAGLRHGCPEIGGLPGGCAGHVSPEQDHDSRNARCKGHHHALA
jgi:hypothetical protein